MTNDETNTPTGNNGAAQNDNKAADSSGQPDLNTLQAELENSRNQLNELTRISQQALADLQNFKKRTEEEKIKFVAFANAALISEILPVIDDLERAMNHLPADPAGREWATGIAIVFKKLQDILAAHGLEPIQTTGQNFDPTLHEAMLMEEGTPDQIIRELAKGYKIGERVIRRSQVVVGQSSQPASQPTQTGPTDGQTAPATKPQ
jgi:molecular chaperone GrpE